MPIYEYHCTHCEKDFELIRKFSEADQPAQCPQCSHSGMQRKLSVCFSSKTGESGSVSTSSCSGCSGGNCSHCH